MRMLDSFRCAVVLVNAEIHFSFFKAEDHGL